MKFRGIYGFLQIAFAVWLYSAICFAQITPPQSSPQQSSAAFAIKSSSVKPPQPLLEPAQPLEPESAFKLTGFTQGSVITLAFQIADGYYLYKDKFKLFTVKTTPYSDSRLLGSKVGTSLDNSVGNSVNQSPLNFNLPAGTVKYDNTFSKELEVYRQSVAVTIDRTALRQYDTDLNAALVPTSVIYLDSQGCADIGVCYPPQRHKVTFTNDGAIVNIALVDASSGLAVPAANEVRSQDAIRTAEVALFDKGTVWLVLSFLGFGLLLSFTPCVLPMVPIVLAIVIRSNAPIKVDPLSSVATSTRNASNVKYRSGAAPNFYKVLLYVLSMSISYALLGVLAAWLGASVSAYLQQPMVLFAFAGLMLFFAGAQFGWYALKLPAFISSRLDRYSAPQADIRSYGIVLMGIMSALVVGPCVTAPLASALSYIATTGNLWTGGLALFSMGLGMGIPLLLIGITGISILPKAGAWMSKINHILGVLLLCLALWTVQSLLPSLWFTLACIGLLVLLSEGFGAFDSAQPQDSRLFKLFKALGWVCMAWAVAIVWGVLGGRYDPLQPLTAQPSAGALTIHAGDSAATKFTRLASQDVMNTLRTATQNGYAGKPILLDVYADWCVSCIEFERFTLRDESVRTKLASFTLLQVDVTRNSDSDRQLLKQLGLFGPPALLFYNPRGQELSTKRVIGFQDAPTFSQHLSTILNLSAKK